MRVVVDTNVWISGLIYSDSVPGRACQEVYARCKPIFTEATLAELARVMQKKKFVPLFTPQDQSRLIKAVQGLSAIVPVTQSIKACRDPKDDKFLEAAVHGGADVLITGDDDLLMLHPFMKVTILTPADFLKKMDSGTEDAD